MGWFGGSVETNSQSSGSALDLSDYSGPGWTILLGKISVSDPDSLNPDPAKDLNPVPGPSYFLTISEIFFFITS